MFIENFVKSEVSSANILQFDSRLSGKSFMYIENNPYIIYDETNVEVYKSETEFKIQYKQERKKTQKEEKLAFQKIVKKYRLVKTAFKKNNDHTKSTH